MVSNRSVDESSSLKHITRLKKLFVVRITRRDEAVYVRCFLVFVEAGWLVGWTDGVQHRGQLRGSSEETNTGTSQTWNIQSVSKCKLHCCVRAEIYLVVQRGTELKLMLLCFGNERNVYLIIYACFVGCNSMEREIVQGLYVVCVGRIAPKRVLSSIG